VADAGDLGASGWQTVEYTAGTDGTYTFGFAMLNAAGSRGISRLFVDNIRLQETAAFEFRTLDVVTDSLGGSIRRLAAAPLANADAFSVPANETLTRPGAAGLLANDVDPDPFDALSIAGIDRTGAVGRASVDSGNTLVYDPRGRFDALAAGETATDGFAYLVDGGNGITQRGQVSVTVTGVNDAPLARPDAAAASEDDPAVNIGVTRNDSDIDSDDSAATLRVIAASAASGADIEFSGLPGDGIIYRPSAVARFQLLDDGETATDLITYTIADRHGAEATATVTVTVFGRDEGGVDEFARTGEDSALALSAGDILANTFGADAAAKLTITGIDAAQATAAVGFDGRTLTYDPTGRFDALGTGESRGETIGFTATDAGGNAVTASLKVTVLGLNDAPAALDDAAATAENARVSIDVTANDRDADAGDALDVIAIDTTGTRGTVALAADGTLTYDPAGRFDALVEGETATDSFRYTVADGQGGESSAEVAVRVLGRNDLERLASSFEQPLTFDERTTTFVRTVGDYRETDGDGASFLPTDGALMARIEARGSSTGVIESFLGLAAGSLPRDIDGSFPAIGAAVRVPVAVEAGDRVSFDWMFDARDFTRNPPDGLADNDLALFTVDDGSGGADLFRLTDVRQVGDQGASGWRTSVYTAPASGTLIIGFASVNDRTVETSGPEAENSFLLVDNVRVNRAFGDGYQVVDSQGDGAFETVAHAQAVA
jgi:VCBS repeat-containing protein